MGRIARPLTGPRAQQNEDLERRETDRRVSSAASAAQGVVGRHVWTYSNSAVAPFSTFTVPSWTRVRDDGIATLDNAGGIVLVPGRWAIHAVATSDSPAVNSRAVFTLPMPWLMDGFGLQDMRMRGSGYANAGNLNQVLSWSGPLDGADVATPITALFLHAHGGGVTAASLTIRVQVNYLGPATFADVGEYEEDPITAT